MKNKKRFLIGMLSSFMLAATVGGAVACKDDDKPKAPGYDETGIYYVDVNNEEYVLSLSGNAFTLLVNNETQTGTYKYDGDNVNFKFKDVKTPVVGDLDETDGTLTMEINGVPYRFFKKVTYSVSFVTNCDETIAPVKVTNGRKVEKPADPYKDGYVFLGWYSDANFTTAFAFDSMPVTKDTTLYALFVKDEAGQDEFTATFVVDGTVVEEKSTVNGAVVAMPTPEVTGKTFVGWWYSDTNDAEKLTAKYEGQKLAANTNFYAVFATDAPAVSVAANGVKWSAKSGANNTYFVTVTAPDGTKAVDNESVGAESFAFDFTTKAAGEWKVEVTLNGKTTTVYYANKTLDRVSKFTVADPCVLVFNPVAKAEKYIVSYTCGDEAHAHESFDNGTSTYFNFANCPIPVEGITFTVTAVAKGYASSVSETFTYTRNLDAVENVAVENDTVVWDSVANATKYVVMVNGEAVATVSGNSYSLKALVAGNYTVSVQAVAATYNSMDGTEVAYVKTTLAAPTVTVNGKVVTWTAVDGATKYVVSVNGTTAEVAEGTTYTIPDTVFVDGTEVYDVTVEAVAENTANNAVSDVVALYKATMSEVTYDKGVLSWSPVANATRYEVQVGNATYNVIGKNYFDVTFVKDGATELKVRAICTDSESEWATTTVNVYAINFEELLVGSTQHPTVYKAVGDPFVAEDAVRKGYKFLGWYNLPDGPKNNAKKYDSTYFDVSGNITLFGCWQHENVYKAKFVYGVDENGAELYFEQEMFFGEAFTLQVPTPTDGAQGFVGWYYDTNTRLTDEFGNGLMYWPFEREVEVYAEFAEVLSFQEVLAGDGTSNTVWQVLQGDEISKVKQVKIPAEYNGKAVTIVAAEAFKNCEDLEAVLIPDTIKEITIPVDGGNASGSAFVGCDNLKKVDLYCVNEADHARHETMYSTTEEGILLKTAEGITDIEYVPHGLSGTLTIPYGVTRINVRRLSGLTFTTVKIPASVTSIEQKAFYSNKSLTTVEFLPAPEGEEEVPLAVMAEAFQDCTSLKTIKLPSRLASLDPLAFKYCDFLHTIDVEDGGEFSSVDGVLLANDGKDLVAAPTAVKPNGADGVFEIPAGVETVKKNAFYLSDLEKIHIPGFVETIEDEAFSYATEVKSITFEDGDLPLTIGSKGFYRNLKVTQIILPERLVSIGSQAFGQITTLSTVTVNMKNPTGIASNVFAGNVRNLTIGANAGAFNVAGVFGNSVVNLTVDPANQAFSRDAAGVLFDKDQTEVSYVPLTVGGDYALPDTVVTIGDNIFKGNTNLTKITIGANVTTIGASAFNGCNKLTAVVFDGGTANLSIGASAFVGTKLETFEIPMTRGTFVLGSSALANVTTLKTVKLPATLNQLGSVSGTTFNSPFDGCNNITTFTIGANNEGSAKYKVVDGVVCEFVDGVQKSILFAPKKVAVGVDGAVTVPTTVTTIYNKAFYQNETLKSITFAGEMPDLQFGADAFAYASGLQTFTFPEGMTTIGSDMFKSNNNLQKIVVPGSVTSIGYRFAVGCNALTEIEFKEGDETLVLNTGKEIGFIERCNALQTLEIPERVATLNFCTAIDCKGLTKVVIPSTVTSFAANGNHSSTSGTTTAHTGLFSGCTALRDVEFTLKSNGKAGFTSIPAWAFANSGPLEIEIPEGVTAVAQYAFAGYTKGNNLGVKSVTFPSTIKTINNYAFYNSQLSSLSFEGCTALATIGKYAFSSTKNTFTSVVIPANVQNINEGAFSNQKRLTSITFATYTEGDNAGKNALKKLDASSLAGTGISTLTLPETTNSTLTLGSGFVNKAKYLRTVNIPAKVTAIKGAFDGCPWITSFNFADGSPFVVQGSYIVKAADSSIQHTWKEVTDTEYTVTTATVGEGVFKGAPFKKVIISSNVTMIGATAFQGCLDLEEVVFEEGCNITEWGELNMGMMPGTLDQITSRVFEGCTSLKKVTLSSTMTSLAMGMFENCSSLDELTYHGCESTEKFNLPVGITEIPNTVGMLWGEPYDEYCLPGAFAGTAFTKIVLPAGMTELGVYMFQDCKNLETIEMGNAVATIKYGAFDGCTALTSLELPNTVSVLGGGAFNGCLKLKEIKVKGVDCADNEVTLPEGIVELGGDTFNGCTSVTKVNLPAGLMSIGAYEFYESGITTITLPANIDYIDESTFRDCTNLSEVNVLGGITYVGTSAFENCTSLEYFDPNVEMDKVGNKAFANSGLKSVMLRLTAANGIWNDEAFRGCQNLTTIYISDHVKTLGYWRMSVSKLEDLSYTFADCPNLKTMGVILSGDKILVEENVITLPSGLVHMGTGTFANSGIERVKGIPDGVAFGSSDRNGNGLSYVFMNCTQLVSVDLPKTVVANKMGDGVFQGCTALEHVSLPTDLVGIGANFFKESGLTAFEVPAMVESIGDEAFARCYNLPAIDVNPANVKFTAIDGVLYNYEGTTMLAWPGAKPIGDLEYPTTSVKAYAYANNDSITSVVIPEGVTSLPEGVFMGATNLTSIVIPASVTSISANAFKDCTALASVTFAEGSKLTSLGANAFENTAISSVVIPAGVTAIPDYAFAGTNLTAIEIPANVTSIGVRAFKGCALANITIAEGSKLTTINAQAFYGSTVESIALPAGVTTLQTSVKDASTVYYSAFNGMTNLKTVTFAEDTKITEIGSYWFKDTTITSIAIPVTVTSIGNYAFDGCTNLATVTFAEGNVLTTINQYAFRGTAIKTFTNIQNLVTVGSGAFSNCVNLEGSFEFGDSLESIGAGAFTNCTKITSLRVPYYATVSSGAFSGWTAEQTVTIETTEWLVKMTWSKGWENKCGATLVWESKNTESES